jgi:hypothetical protein
MFDSDALYTLLYMPEAKLRGAVLLMSIIWKLPFVQFAKKLFPIHVYFCLSRDPGISPARVLGRVHSNSVISSLICLINVFLRKNNCY